MTTRTSRRLSALALPLCLAFAAPANRVAFAPEAGTELSKLYTTELSLQLDDFSLSVGGQEMDASMMGDMEVNIDYESEYGVLDTYVETSDGRPVKLERMFDSLGGNMSFNVANEMMGNEDQSMEFESELEGTTVVFSWNGDEENYTKSFKDEDEGDAELLEGIQEDMDLRMLLPAGEVEEGATWELDLTLLEHVILPGGDLALDPGEDVEQPDMSEDMTEMIEGMMGDMLDELLGGSASCTYEGTRTEGDITVAVIKLEVEIDGNTSMVEMIRKMISAAQEQEEEMEVDLSVEVADLEIGYEGSGTLLWNVANGHLYSFEMSGEMFAAVDVSMGIDMGGQTMNQDISVEFSGSYGSAVSLR